MTATAKTPLLVPIAMPAIAGPAALTTVAVLTTRQGVPVGRVIKALILCLCGHPVHLPGRAQDQCLPGSPGHQCHGEADEAAAEPRRRQYDHARHTGRVSMTKLDSYSLPRDSRACRRHRYSVAAQIFSSSALSRIGRLCGGSIFFSTASLRPGEYLIVFSVTPCSSLTVSQYGDDFYPDTGVVALRPLSRKVFQILSGLQQKITLSGYTIAQHFTTTEIASTGLPSRALPTSHHQHHEARLSCLKPRSVRNLLIRDSALYNNLHIMETSCGPLNMVS